MMDTLKVFNSFNELILKKCKHENVEKELIVVWKYIYKLSVPILTTKKELVFNPIKSNIILTMTSCKRLHLFKQTVNSMLNTWIDLPLIEYFFVVDDNSDEEDRNEMINEYKFIDFYMKNEDEKGHLCSMNIIYNKLKELDVKYWIHVEDDFLFFYSTTYVTTGINGLNSLGSFNVKQIMFNRNYIETIDQINIPGHIPYSDNTYALHDYKLNGTACRYWPYFSFRPSIIDAKTIISLGNFDSSNVFFERDYANKYNNAGYKTAFLNSVTSIHIGKLCNELGSNAYSLNKIPQFNSDYRIKVINLKRRPDRLEEITKKLNIEHDIVTAVDGNDLIYNEEIETLFKGNDFHSRKNVIGCALSHYYLWKELVESDCPLYVIIEDDASFYDNFKNKLNNILYSLYERDIVFMGYLIYNNVHDKYKYKYCVNSNTISISSLEKKLYLGGTHCYSITKLGAKKILEYIKTNGIKHGIDYLIAKVQDICEVFETVPHLSYIKSTDSDIQFNSDFFTELETIDDYIFMKGLDQINYDIYKENTDTSLENMRKKTKEMGGIAFNTFGYIKNKIEHLTRSPCFSNKDGIYIHNDYYFNVLKKSENNRIRY